MAAPGNDARGLGQIDRIAKAAAGTAFLSKPLSSGRPLGVHASGTHPRGAPIIDDFDGNRDRVAAMLAIFDPGLRPKGQVDSGFVRLPAMRAFDLDHRIQWSLTRVLAGLEDRFQPIQCVHLSDVGSLRADRRSVYVGPGSGGALDHQNGSALATAR